MVSAFTDKRERPRCADAGANAFIDKPLTIEKLADTLSVLKIVWADHEENIKFLLLSCFLIYTHLLFYIQIHIYIYLYIHTYIHIHKHACVYIKYKNKLIWKKKIKSNNMNLNLTLLKFTKINISSLLYMKKKMKTYM